MELRSIHIDDTADRQYVTLAEKGGERTLTIVIAWNEVQAIDRFVKGTHPPRPLTHELLVALLTAAGATVEQIAITEFKEGTFYALVRLTRADGGTVEVDARPSDALAIAAALDKPIFVEAAVIEAAEAD
jgi:hypothetical protein